MRSGGAFERSYRLALYETRTSLSAHPSVFLPYARRRYPDGRVVGPGTKITIDGFQRSANTFAVVAFESAQPAPVRIAHHLHAVAQIAESVRRRIPTVVLIREPEACALSHVIRNRYTTPRIVLASWTRFYERLLPLRDDVVIAPFEAVTKDLGKVIAATNARFGTDFAPFEHDEANVEACFRAIERQNTARHGTVVETRVARPSAVREELREAGKLELAAPELARLRSKASAVYRTWLATADAQASS